MRHPVVMIKVRHGTGARCVIDRPEGPATAGSAPGYDGPAP